MGVESYQKKLNLIKPDTYRSNLRRRDAYTPYSDPRGFIYENKDKKNRLMRIDELHKFSDGTLDDVRTALNDRLKGIRIEYLPQTFWSQRDKANARALIQAIDKRLKTRRIMQSLERFVGGRPYGEHAEYDESNTYVLERFNTTAGNPVKKILLKLNLSDHRLFKDGGGVAFLEKPTESEGFEEIVDFLNANPIKYALTVNPTIYCSCVKQFWDTVKAKTVNGEVQLQALVDKKKVIITESTIRRDLQLEDANGVDCLPNAAIFEQLTLMGYEKLSQKLTFYKAFFSPQWKFLIHTILQCLSAKTTAWNEFSSTMASAIICLATNQKFNFSKYIFDNMVKNVDSMVKFWISSPFWNIGTNRAGFGGKIQIVELEVVSILQLWEWMIV
ncbi:hypothetical protein Tco_0554639 [Tanacetum coccineum]